ncbi:MAG: hypothetical protein PHO95_09245 [Bacteroidales bacterium]|jgi:hypothetical protein|nr:hypothetical protein [Bacteroidales bacterium]
MKKSAYPFIATVAGFMLLFASLSAQSIVKPSGEPLSFLEFAVACDFKSPEQIKSFFEKKGWNYLGSQWESSDSYGWERFSNRNRLGDIDSATVYIFDKRSIRGLFKTSDRQIYQEWMRYVGNSGYQTESLLVERDLMTSSFFNSDYKATFYEKEKTFRDNTKESLVVVVEKR